MKKIEIELCNYSLECELPFKFTEKRFEKYTDKFKEMYSKAKGYIEDETSEFHFIANSIRLKFEGCIPIDEAKQMLTNLVNDIK